jgi:hypothetical protein
MRKLSQNRLLQAAAVAAGIVALSTNQALARSHGSYGSYGSYGSSGSSASYGSYGSYGSSGSSASYGSYGSSGSSASYGSASSGSSGGVRHVLRTFFVGKQRELWQLQPWKQRQQRILRRLLGPG